MTNTQQIAVWSDKDWTYYGTEYPELEYKSDDYRIIVLPDSMTFTEIELLVQELEDL